MKKNAMRKNLRQSIRNSFGRYVALMMIIGLGASLFMGLLITRQDMVATGQQFMDQQNMFDLRMISNYGWSEKYVEQFAQLPGVEEAEGIVYLDMIARTENNSDDTVYRLYAMPEKLNLVSVQSGRMPQNAQECVVEGFFTDDSILGKKLIISSLNEEDSLDALRTHTFTIVGRISSPLYLDMNRGTTAVGSGSLEMYFYLPAESFDVDYYTEINLTLEAQHDIYTDDYHDFLEDTMDALEPEAEKLANQRFLDIKEEAEEEYADGYQEYLDGVQEYEDGKAEAEQELADAEQELKDAEVELEENRLKLLRAQNQIEDGMKQIEAGFAQLELKEKECEDNLAAVRSELKPAQDGVAYFEAMGIQQKYDEASASLASADAAVVAAKQNYAAAQANGATEDELKTYLDAITNAENAQAVVVNNTSPVMAQYGEYRKAVEGLNYLKNLETTLLDGLAHIHNTAASLQETYNELKASESKLWVSWAEWGEGRDEIAEGWIEYEDAKIEVAEELAEAEAELKDAEEDLREAREEIDSMDESDLIMLSRTSNVGYNNLDSSSNIVAGVARVLPVFFLLVASLVCITTMTRMIDEERTQIGTLKALGYTNGEIMRKYLVYSGSGAVIGCCLGLFLGCTLFPVVIWEAYKMMLYIQPRPVLTANWPLSIIIVVVYTALMLSVTWYSCKKTLEEEPAQLIRPKAPDPGKKIFLERLWIWKKLSFLNKVTIRNIFRYRQRMAMMLIGISGCTALLLTGFGLRDSIVNIVPCQYQEITRYDMSVYFREAPTEQEQKEFAEVVADVDNFMFYHQSSVDLEFENRAKELYMISGNEKLTEFIDLHSGKEALPLPGIGEIVLSVGVCENLGIQVGDTLTLRNADLQRLDLIVSGIYDNYVDNFGLVHPDTIAGSWGEAPEEQMAFVRVAPDQDAYAVSAAISELDSVLNVSVSQDLADMIGSMMDALDLVIILIVVCAGLLAVIVLYNLTNININERIREIATIKVLGFRASETGSYVFKENMILTVIGSLLGLGLGWGLLSFVIAQIKIDMVWFKATAEPLSYVLSVGLTLISSLIVDFIFYFKLDKINMAEALKSVE
ncbi:MAG: FtsX-like permease family protein [Oscillospiraceae bacterium]